MRRVACLTALVLAASAAPASAQNLEAGAGRADITPPTGYFFMGWVRSDAKAEGQHTRLFARAIVLRRGGRKVALVSTDLGALPNGMVVDAAERLANRGFTEENIVVSASHTHGGPSGYFNFSAFNTVAPTKDTPLEFRVGEPADRQLYSFMVRRLAAAIRRADADRGPAVAGWGETRILGLTDNRSIEAHLADHGIVLERGEGSVAMDPEGYVHTIDPEVHVLRVDKVVRSAQSRSRAPAFTGRVAQRRLRTTRVPIGIWSTFSNHGTVNKPSFTFYNADHHGSATRVVEAGIRAAGKVPRSQEVVNAYGNTDEGDISSGLHRSGPASADAVGRTESRAMMRAWRSARRRLSTRPALDSRWTRVCYCGQETSAGAVDDVAVVGAPFLTGSEENRGPLFDITGAPFEGVRSPVPVGAQGHKVRTYTDVGGAMPKAVPLTAVRVADRMVVTIPGEMTAEMGRRLRESVVSAAAGSGVRRAVISGLGNDFIQYFTTPEEYDRQHYEGGSMLYGRAAGVLLQERLAELTSRLVSGQPAPEAYPFDARNGVSDDAPPFPLGATRGSASAQPSGTQRLARASFSWTGAGAGLDRPLDRPFVSVERVGGGTVANDLGLQILWSVDDEGNHSAFWQVPLDARPGRYRFVVTANRYRLASRSFTVGASSGLEPTVVRSEPGSATIALNYPQVVENQDLTARPLRAGGARFTVIVDGRRRTLRGTEVTVRGAEGTTATVPAGGARDRHGNTNGVPFNFGL